MTAVIDVRRPSALPASPRACSSITRSSRLATNVTPLALIAWRSHGASSHGVSARRAPAVEFASTSASEAMAGSGPARRIAATGSSRFSSWLAVGAMLERS